MRHTPNRREFLQASAALGIAAQSSALGQALSLPLRPFFQDTPAVRTLVVVFLRGGADFLNMIIPRDDLTYSLMRPTVGIGEENGLVPLDSDWGLHPALAPLEPLYKEKLLAPLVCVGSPHATRSHFDAQDFMENAAPGSRTVHSGWLNRYLQVTTGEARGSFRALAMQGLLPQSLRGKHPVLAVSRDVERDGAWSVLDSFESLYDADGMGDGETMDAGAKLGDVVESGKVTIETLRQYRDIIATADPEDHGYPTDGFGNGLRRIGQVLESGENLEIAGIDLNGWDHHAGLGAAEGPQATKLARMAQALVAFRKHMGPRMEQIMVMVMTEFGRSVIENGSAGTDHGHGGGMLLLGGGVKGGEVHGEWRGLSPGRLYQGRDLPVTTDFRDVFAEVLREHLDFKAPRGFFPDYSPQRLKLF